MVSKQCSLFLQHCHYRATAHKALRDLAVPSSLQLADVLHVGRPVQVTSSLILEPVPQLLPVDFQEICEQHLFENLTATQHLVQGGT